MWPENELALRMFSRVGTRWQYLARGMNGQLTVVGLQWQAIYPLLDRLGLPPDEWDELLHSLEIMEQAALPVIRAAMSGKNT